MADDKSKASDFTYRYFILDNITPVRLKFKARNDATGAQVPDAGEPDGFRWSHNHWTRIGKNEEVEEVDKTTFEKAVEGYLPRARETKTGN